MSRESILSQVRDSIKNNNISYNLESYSSPMKLTYSNLLEEYKFNQSNNKTIIRETDKNSLLEVVSSILEENNSKKILYNMDIEFNFNSLNSKYSMLPYSKSVDSMREELFNIDTSIVKARCGVANLGIVGLSSSIKSPRLSSLITNVCIYLLQKENIVENLYDGINFIKKYEVEFNKTDILPTNIIFVAGPSRTADIELQTVFGVHGPRVTYVILY